MNMGIFYGIFDVNVLLAQSLLSSNQHYRHLVDWWEISDAEWNCESMCGACGEIGVGGDEGWGFWGGKALRKRVGGEEKMVGEGMSEKICWIVKLAMILVIRLEALKFISYDEKRGRKNRERLLII